MPEIPSPEIIEEEKERERKRREGEEERRIRLPIPGQDIPEYDPEQYERWRKEQEKKNPDQGRRGVEILNYGEEKES